VNVEKSAFLPGRLSGFIILIEGEKMNTIRSAKELVLSNPWSGAVVTAGLYFAVIDFVWILISLPSGMIL
jgi:hypothetical protein